MPSNSPILTNRITINGAEYTITSEGKVYGRSGKEISIRPNSDGYACFTAGVKGRRISVRVHRLVAELFLPNPNNLPEIDHKDSNRMNPSLQNLEWVTHAENIKRAYARGNHDGRAVGEKNPRSRINRELVMQMRIQYIIQKIPIAVIGRQYDVPWSTVNNVVKGYTWKNVPMPTLEQWVALK